MALELIRTVGFVLAVLVALAIVLGALTVVATFVKMDHVHPLADATAQFV